MVKFQLKKLSESEYIRGKTTRKRTTAKQGSKNQTCKNLALLIPQNLLFINTPFLHGLQESSLQTPKPEPF